MAGPDGMAATRDGSTPPTAADEQALKAEFTSTPARGYAPLEVNFIDQSTTFS